MWRAGPVGRHLWIPWVPGRHKRREGVGWEGGWGSQEASWCMGASAMWFYVSKQTPLVSSESESHVRNSVPIFQMQKQRDLPRVTQ